MSYARLLWTSSPTPSPQRCPASHSYGWPKHRQNMAAGTVAVIGRPTPRPSYRLGSCAGQRTISRRTQFAAGYSNTSVLQFLLHDVTPSSKSKNLLPNYTAALQICHLLVGRCVFIGYYLMLMLLLRFPDDGNLIPNRNFYHSTNLTISTTSIIQK